MLVSYGQLRGREDKPLPGNIVPLPSNTIETFFAFCIEVYPTYGTCKITSATNGDMIIPCPSSMGVRSGDTLKIEKTLGNPRITQIISYGYTPKNIVCLNLSPIGKEEKISLIDEEPEWPRELGQHIGMNPYYIAHKEGEKVYNVGLTGLKIGYSGAYLFSGANSRVVVGDSDISIISEQISQKTKGTIYISGVAEDGEGYSQNSIMRTTDKEVFGVLHEFKGDVVEGLSNIGITEMTIPLEIRELDDIVYMMLVLDENIDDYKINTKEVSHKYKESSLKISGEKGEDLTINKELRRSIDLKMDNFKYSSGVAIIDGDRKPITYLKAVSIRGDILEFGAGERTQSTKNAKDMVLQDKQEVVLGNATKYTQGNITNKHFPIDEESTDIKIFYGDSTSLKYGRDTVLITEESKQVTVDHTIETKLEKIGKITPRYQMNTPKFIMNGAYAKYTYAEPTKGKNKFDVYLSWDMTTSSGNNHLSMSSQTGALDFNSVNKKKKSRFHLGPNSGIVSTEGTIVLLSDRLEAKNKRTSFYGKTYFRKGIDVIGDFTINADNIIFRATKSIVLDATASMVLRGKAMFFSFSDNFSLASTKRELNGKKALAMSRFSMSQSGYQLSGENGTLQSADNITIYSQKTLTMGSKDTSIAGLPE